MFNLEDWGLEIESPTHCTCCGHEYTFEEPICKNFSKQIEKACDAINRKIFEIILKACEENNV